MTPHCSTCTWKSAPRRVDRSRDKTWQRHHYCKGRLCRNTCSSGPPGKVCPLHLQSRTSPTPENVNQLLAQLSVVDLDKCPWPASRAEREAEPWHPLLLCYFSFLVISYVRSFPVSYPLHRVVPSLSFWHLWQRFVDWTSVWLLMLLAISLGSCHICYISCFLSSMLSGHCDSPLQPSRPKRSLLKLVDTERSGRTFALAHDHALNNRPSASYPPRNPIALLPRRHRCQ